MDFQPFISIARAAEEASHSDPGIVGIFGLNWKLFLAQLINFSVILLVLWKWVFKPVSSALEKRTKKIEDSLVEAQKIAEEKQTFESWKQSEIATVRTEAIGIIKQAKSEGETIKNKLLAETKAEQEKIIAQGKTVLIAEQQKAVEKAKEQLADLVIVATEKLINQKLDQKQDAKLIEQALANAKSEMNKQ